MKTLSQVIEGYISFHVVIGEGEPPRKILINPGNIIFLEELDNSTRLVTVTHEFYLSKEGHILGMKKLDP